jgi:peptidoglycan hydrolase CwlO-like protein
MYTSGNISVSYMEVLLASTDFGDFVNRITMLTMVIKQDKRLIETMTENLLVLICILRLQQELLEIN